MGSNSNDCCPYNEREIWIHIDILVCRRPCDDKGRDWSDAATSREKLTVAHKKLNKTSLQSQHGPANTLEILWKTYGNTMQKLHFCFKGKIEVAS